MYLTMLVGTAQKEHLSSTQAHKARNNITRHRRVGMTNMRLVVDVVNGCCDFERTLAIIKRRGWCSRNVGMQRAATCGGIDGYVKCSSRREQTARTDG